MKLLLVFSLLLSFSAAYAGRCNDKYPVFIVNNQVIWDDVSAKEIFEKADKKPIAKAKKVNATGILLADLIKPYATKGTVLIKSCGKRSASYKVADLLSKDKKKSAYYLAKTKKQTFKLVFADGVKKPGAVLKRLQTIELIAEKVVSAPSSDVSVNKAVK